eukprot:IDg670t1
MDNAKHRKCPPPDTPKIQKLKKADVLAYLDSINIAYAQGIKAADAKALAKRTSTPTSWLRFLSLAEAAGNRFVFTPPHFSDLQPIELVWALVKGNGGQKISRSSNPLTSTGIASSRNHRLRPTQLLQETTRAAQRKATAAATKTLAAQTRRKRPERKFAISHEVLDVLLGPKHRQKARRGCHRIPVENVPLIKYSLMVSRTLSVLTCV